MNGHAKKTVVVIGGGIAGLAAAYYLRKQGIETTIIERDKILGGKTRSVIRDERYVVDLGPCAFFEDDTMLMRLAGDLSVKEFIVGDKKPIPNYSIWTGRGFKKIPPGKISSLSKKVLSRIFRPKRSDKIENPEKIISHIFRNGKTPPLSFRWGMGTLTARFEEELRNRAEPGAMAKSVERRRDGGLKVYIENLALPIEADAVVVATPAPEAAKLLRVIAPEASKHLSEICYFPLIIVHTSFAEVGAPKMPDGFGVLFERAKGTRLLFSILTSAIFPNRCPKGEMLITSFLGGENDTTAIDMSDEEIMSETLSGIGKVLGIQAKPKFTYVRRWGQAAPVFTAGHEERTALINENIAKTNGVFLLGSYLSDFSISNIVSNARNEADKIAAYLKNYT